MQPSRIFETVYAEDLAAAERFYHQALGLEVIGRGESFSWFSVVTVESCWCLILARVPHRGRDVPSHGTIGAGHIAFAVKPKDLAAWEGAIASGCNPHRA